MRRTALAFGLAAILAVGLTGPTERFTAIGQAQAEQAGLQASTQTAQYHDFGADVFWETCVAHISDFRKRTRSLAKIPGVVLPTELAKSAVQLLGFKDHLYTPGASEMRAYGDLKVASDHRLEGRQAFTNTVHGYVGSRGKPHRSFCTSSLSGADRDQVIARVTSRLGSPPAEQYPLIGASDVLTEWAIWDVPPSGAGLEMIAVIHRVDPTGAWNDAFPVLLAIGVETVTVAQTQ